MIEWNLPAHWGTRVLGDVAPEETEQITPSDNPDAIFNYWGLDAIRPGDFSEPAPNYVKGNEILSTCIKFSSDHILYSKLRPYLNKVIVPSISGIGSTEWVVLTPNQSLINRKYLGYVLRTQKFVDYANYYSAGGRMPRAKKSALRIAEIPIPFPDDPTKSLSTQTHIVSRIEGLLSELTEARQLHEKIVADTNRLMDAVLAETFPDPEKGLPKRWGAKPLSTMASEKTKQIIPSDHPSDTFNYWGLDAISEGQIIEPSPNYIKGSDVKSTCVFFSSRHVLYSKLRPYLNKVIVPSIDGIGSTEWVVYEPNPNILRRKYLAFVMRTKWFVNMASNSSYGARMPRANKSVLREIKIPIPFISDPAQSLSIQDQIVERITQFSSDVDSMRKGNNQQEELLTQLEQSILAQAFRGEL